jgi:hypothetical protein
VATVNWKQVKRFAMTAIRTIMTVAITVVIPTDALAIFEYTGGSQTFVVPQCARSIIIEAWGAQGGGGYAVGEALRSSRA